MHSWSEEVETDFNYLHFRDTDWIETQIETENEKLFAGAKRFHTELCFTHLFAANLTLM